MPILVWILLTTLTVSVLAWVGVGFIVLRDRLLRWTLDILVAFAAGALLAAALLHLLPETIDRLGPQLPVFSLTIAGFALFFLLELSLQGHYHLLPSSHGHEHGKTPVTYMLLIADGLHNLIDGLAIGTSFLLGVDAGLVTTVAVAAHEIPQELGDFGILVHGGWSKRRALVVNYLSALTIVPGGLLAYVLGARADATLLLPIAAGNFIYIAAADLVPEMKHETTVRQSAVRFVSFVAGVGLLLGLKVVFGG